MPTLSVSSKSLTAFAFSALLAVGCAPAEDEATPASETIERVDTRTNAGSDAAASPSETSEAAPIREGSGPKDGDEPSGLEATAIAAAEGEIDSSIREAAEFGDDALLAGLAPEGWSQGGDIEHYNVATLYNKIDGRSELYMAYDVRGLSWVSFVDDTDPNNFLDLFLYDMRDATNAFGIFSVEREPGQPPVDIGRIAYRTGSNYYFWKGRYYGYINASKDSEENRKIAYGILVALMQRLPDANERVAGLDLLPEEGRIDDTIQYFKVDAMSLDFLTETFSAEYAFADATARVFVSERDSTDEAASIIDSFLEYGENYSEGAKRTEVDGTEVVIADWGGGFYDAAFHIDNLVAGLSNVQGEETLNTALETVVARLKE